MTEKQEELRRVNLAIEIIRNDYLLLMPLCELERIVEAGHFLDELKKEIE